MSTAGKVLTFLVVLVAIVWVVLTAGVAELNRNGTRAVDDLRKKVAKLEVDVREAGQQLEAVKSETHLEQARMDNDLTVRQVAQSEWEKRRSLTKESLSRVQLQLADAEAVLKTGGAHKDQREAEKEAETKALADSRAEVEALKAEREKLVGRLTELRDKFRTTLQENKSLVERLRKSIEKAKPVSTTMVRPPSSPSASPPPVIGD
jgi:chromosome segregation ATPase